MHFDIVTLFPDFFRGPFDYGVLHRALRDRRVSVATHDLREHTTDRHRTVDDRPFGGGEGMVLKPEPLFACVESLGVAPTQDRRAAHQSVILLSAAGRPFNQAIARHLSGLSRVVLLCGRYEGVDERVAHLLCDDELSVGDFVLSGGELAAALIVDAVVRLLPGVLGHDDSARFESFGEGEAPGPSSRGDGTPRATHASGGLLDYPHYTRPAVFRGVPIPAALASGDHLAVRAWRRRAALARTLKMRPDLLAAAELSPEDHAALEDLRREQASEAGTPDKTP